MATEPTPHERMKGHLHAGLAALEAHRQLVEGAVQSHLEQHATPATTPTPGEPTATPTEGA